MDAILAQRPVRLYAYEHRDDHHVTVLVPRFGDHAVGRLLARIAVFKESKLDLDEFGSFVYLACDGSRSVSEIAVMLKEKFGEKVEPLEGRLVLFIQELFKRNLISFSVVKPATQEPCDNTTAT